LIFIPGLRKGNPSFFKKFIFVVLGYKLQVNVLINI
jgi:hypothetical protein